jgi:hemolysin activation/secretion protein
MTELTVAHGFGATGQFKVTSAGGYSLGDLPAQRDWYLGGPYTVHAYRVGSVAGDAFWMGRAQIASGHPVFRPVLFGDIGWAGQRDSIAHAKPISSAGAGFAALDGFVRFDASRAVSPGRQWRLDLYFEIR